MKVSLLKSGKCSMSGWQFEFIKELRMTEPMFAIVAQNKPSRPENQHQRSRYSSLRHSFLSTSYGYYTEIFIKRIAQAAANSYLHTRKCDIRKLIREATKKYMLSDLEVVFLGHFCGKNGWDSQHQLIGQRTNRAQSLEEIREYKMRLFIELNAYLVKSYLGDEEERQEIQAHLTNSDKSFLPLFDQWADSVPAQNYTVSPKQINRVYSQYSRNCQSISEKKDFNDMVDTIIELSTTYSIIPGKKNDKQKDKQREKEKEKEKGENGKSQVNNSLHKLQPFASNRGSQAGKERDSVLRYPENSSIQMVGHTVLPSRMNEPSLIDYRRPANSSAIFDGLFGQSRLSGLRSKKSVQGQVQEVERSRQKREGQPGHKISLKNFKRKEMPNQTVLGCFKNPPAAPIVPQKQHNLRQRQRDGRSYIDNNPSLGLFMASNLSSRSMMLPPIPFKPNEEGFFFDKSRLD